MGRSMGMASLCGLISRIIKGSIRMMRRMEREKYLIIGGSLLRKGFGGRMWQWIDFCGCSE